jgi:hypothetical protein
MFVILEHLYGRWGGGKGKENDRELSISKYITFVQVEDIKMCIESCQKMGECEEMGKGEEQKGFNGPK